MFQMDFSCGANQPNSKLTDTGYASTGSLTALTDCKLLGPPNNNFVLVNEDDDDDTDLYSDSWTISSFPDTSSVSPKEEDDLSFTNVTPLSSYSEDYFIESSTLSDVSSLISWAEGYLLQFEGYDIDNFYSDSADGFIDLKEISQLIIDDILREIISL